MNDQDAKLFLKMALKDLGPKRYLKAVIEVGATHALDWATKLAVRAILEASVAGKL